MLGSCESTHHLSYHHHCPGTRGQGPRDIRANLGTAVWGLGLDTRGLHSGQGRLDLDWRSFSVFCSLRACFPSADGWGSDQRMSEVPLLTFYEVLELKQRELQPRKGRCLVSPGMGRQNPCPSDPTALLVPERHRCLAKTTALCPPLAPAACGECVRAFTLYPLEQQQRSIINQ